MADQTINQLEARLQELADYHHNRLLESGRRIVPTLTSEDMLQPNDYPELDNHPEFRYEEGVFAGVNSALVAFRAALHDVSCDA